MPGPEIRQACHDVTARTVCQGFEKSTYKVTKTSPNKKEENRKEMPKRMVSVQLR